MTTAQLQIGFFSSLVVSVLLLGGVLLTAKLHRVKAHITTVCVMVVTLVITIVCAELLGQRYTYEDLSYWIHLPLAISATLTLAAPLLTGFRHWKGPSAQTLKAHKVSVGVWVSLVLLALGTGIWMFVGATPKAAPADATEQAPRAE